MDNIFAFNKEGEIAANRAIMQLRDCSQECVLSVMAARLLHGDMLIGDFDRFVNTSRRLTGEYGCWGMCVNGVDKLISQIAFGSTVTRADIIKALRLCFADDETSEYEAEIIEETTQAVYAVTGQNCEGLDDETLCAVLCLLCLNDKDSYNYAYTTLIPAFEGDTITPNVQDTHAVYRALDILSYLRSHGCYGFGYECEEAAAIAYALDTLITEKHERLPICPMFGDGYPLPEELCEKLEDELDEPDEPDELDELTETLDWDSFFCVEE